LSGLEALHAEDVREGNIIYAVELVRSTVPSETTLIRLFRSPHPSAAAQYHEAHKRLIADKTAKVVAGNAVVAVITSSYGADLVAFCASATLKFHAPN
jgi:hypothetical protein